ncbi:hypothetical protein [Serratia nevei]|uniref:hypothetical protein n=1 Tax=Serratia nevei TaxID=2703794 RepID=UPI0028553776|nr:hypothetical protein [Serratia nevei]MDR8481511.1 hypothetical protein [Serratia nevei]
MIEKIAKKITRYDVNAYIKRSMWSDLNKRIGDVFNREVKESHSLPVFGDLYLYHENTTYKIADNRRLNIISCEVINVTYIFTGNKPHRVYYDNKGGLNTFCERGAQMWYSQDISGAVLVFVSPCSSAMTSFDEKEIIIGRYKQPVSITEKEIKKHIKVFLSYRLCTGANSSANLRSYIYRIRLQFLDFRNRGKIARLIMQLLYKSAVLVLSAIGILATLYAANKLF